MINRKTKNGFEYYSIRIDYSIWAWFYKPLGAPHSVSFAGKKEDLLNLLREPLKALEAYQHHLAYETDVVKAKASVERAEAFHAMVSSADWDPGGSTNNVGRVARDLKEAAGSARAVAAARDNLVNIIAIKAQVDATPFDYVAWLKTHHPRIR